MSELAEKVVKEDLAFLDAKAEKWLENPDIQRLIASATEVFAKWSNDELMGRFRQQVKNIAREAYVEGAYEAWADIKSRRALASQIEGK